MNRSNRVKTVARLYTWGLVSVALILRRHKKELWQPRVCGVNKRSKGCKDQKHKCKKDGDEEGLNFKHKYLKQKVKVIYLRVGVYKKLRATGGVRGNKRAGPFYKTKANLRARSLPNKNRPRW